MHRDEAGGRKRADGISEDGHVKEGIPMFFSTSTACIAMIAAGTEGLQLS